MKAKVTSRRRRAKGLGNAAAVAASNPDMVKATKDVVINMQNQAQSTARIALTAIVAGVGGYFAYKKFKDWRKQRFVENNAHLPDVQAAMIMRKAMFRVSFDTWPFSMISIPDGTDEAMLNQLARKVSSIQAVVKAYKILFDSNLYVDVANELRDSELLEFFNNLNSSDNYQSGFNPDGSPKAQTPYRHGETLVVKNPNGTPIYKAEEYDDDKYRGTATVRKFLKFGETIGDIVKIYKMQSGQYYYLVDMAWSPDWLLGYGWVAHTEVEPKE